MSLFTITFDSSTEDSCDEPSILIPPPSKSEDTPDNFLVIEELPRLKPGRNYRDLNPPSPRSLPLQHFSEPLTRVTFARETHTKLNGVRIFFRVLSNGHQLFLAKSKSPTAKSIPITNDSKIHLRSESNFIARLVVENNQTDFTLVEKGNKAHFLVVQFSAARFPEDGARRSHIRFLCNSGLPSKLVSMPLTEFRYEIGFPKKSIKNTVFGDDRGNWHIFVRKIGPDSAEIQTKVAVDGLWLFAIGIALFLGKPPKR